MIRTPEGKQLVVTGEKNRVLSDDFQGDCEVRVSDPGVILQEAQARKRRKTLTRDDKLVVLAADHPGKLITKSGDDPIAMGNRQEYLGRVFIVTVFL